MDKAIETLKKTTGKSQAQVTKAVVAFVNGQHASVVSNINHPSVIRQIAEMLK